MAHPENQQGLSAAVPDQPPAEAGSFRTLLRVSAILTGGVAIVAGIYGITTSLLTLIALALETALVAITCLTASSAQRIRGLLATVDASAEADSSRSTEEPQIGRWGDVQWSDNDDQLLDPRADIDHHRMVHFLYASVCPTMAVALLAAFELWGRTGDDATTIALGGATALGLLCLRCGCGADRSASTDRGGV